MLGKIVVTPTTVAEIIESLESNKTTRITATLNTELALNTVEVLLHKVKSTSVKALGWDNDVLIVVFKTGVYAYMGVANSVFVSACESVSVGKYINSVKDNYECVKVEN